MLECSLQFFHLFLFGEKSMLKTINEQSFPTTEEEVRKLYQSRFNWFRNLEKTAEKHANLLSNARLTVFLLSFILFIITFYSDKKFLFATISLLFFILFVFLVIIHQRILNDKNYFTRLLKINNEAIWRLNKNWNALPQTPIPIQFIKKQLAIDLDLFGRASLIQLLNPVTTNAGLQCVLNWFLNPTEPEIIKLRHEAIREIAPFLDLQQTILFYGQDLKENLHKIDGFLSWCEEPSWLLHKPWLIWISRFSAVCMIFFLSLQLSGLFLYPVWLVFFVINMLLTLYYRKNINNIYNQISAGGQDFLNFSHLFKLFSKFEVKSSLLKELKNRFSIGDKTAYQQMKYLDKLVNLTNLRLSELLYFPVQLLTLWDFHVLLELEKWKKQVRSTIRRWFDVFGEFEALTSLGNLYFSHPKWTFPKIENVKSPHLTVNDVGHPLLPTKMCVTNSIELGPDGTFLLVTGSNMSGKSTFLRTIGVNIVLAQLGAPVFASYMSLSPLALKTSFRINDSLENGVSYFMAELKQLKTIVDDANLKNKSGNRTPFFLLDEILLGTNIKERQEAIKMVLIYLLKQHSFGMIATHDLALTDSKELSSKCQIIHFRESFVEDQKKIQMTFDYKLRPGIAPTTNALKLLKMIGLGNLK